MEHGFEPDQCVAIEHVGPHPSVSFGIITHASKHAVLVEFYKRTVISEHTSTCKFTRRLGHSVRYRWVATRGFMGEVGDGVHTRVLPFEEGKVYTS